MSATTATNSLTSTQQREREKQQRERERQRGLQFQDDSVSYLPIANGNVHFSGPIKHEHEDATAKRIKDTLGKCCFLLLLVYGLSSLMLDALSFPKANSIK